MKLSEMARYWAAKQLTQITRQPGTVRLRAPFASPRFSVRMSQKPGTWYREPDGLIVCFDLPKGESEIVLG